MLNRHCGLRVRNLFDTMISAQLLGYPAVGYGALVERHFDVRLSKDQQRTDWSRRPLQGRADRLRRRRRALPASSCRRSSSASSQRPAGWSGRRRSSRALEQRVWPEREFDEQGYLRIKGARKLTPRGLAVLRELFLLRDKRARDGDRPPFKVMGNGTLLDLAQNPPTVAARARQAARDHRPGAAPHGPGSRSTPITRGLEGPEHPPLERKQPRGTDGAGSTGAARRASRS